MPVTFLAVAFIMLLAAAAVIFFPLKQKSDVIGISAPLTAIAIPLVALALYGFWSEWQWPQSDPETERLTAAAHAAPNDPGPWLALGRRHATAGQFQQALTALDRAYELNGGRSAEMSLSVIETLSMMGAVPAERLAELVNEVLTAHPDHPQAQWYAAELAFGRGEFVRAADLWRALLTKANNDSRPEAVAVREILGRRIAQAEAHSAAAESAHDLPTTDTAIKVTVTRDAGFGVDVPGDTPLFVLARAVDAPGPPLAVKRRVAAELPVTVELSDADAMMPGRTLSSHDEVEIVARIAISGGPVAASGDLFGSILVNRGESDAVTIVIDKVTP